MTSTGVGRRKATWNREDRVNLDSTTAERARRIGILGEKLAEAQLRVHGFTKVKNLNHTLRINHLGADLYAERNSVGYWISVKARNKYTEGKKLNDRYKIGPEELSNLAECESRQFGSRAACIVISFVMSDRSTFGGEPPRSYSCYFMPPRKGILMAPRHLATYELFALNEMIPSTEDVSGLENTYERRTPVASLR
nr:hypothetical protein [uncultured Rhodopila sp.]